MNLTISRNKYMFKKRKINNFVVEDEVLPEFGLSPIDNKTLLQDNFNSPNECNLFKSRTEKIRP